MHYINQDIIDTRGILSWRGIQARFVMPNMYGAASITDFVRNREQIEPTQLKVSRYAKSFMDCAILSIHTCHYKKTGDIDDKPAERLVELFAEKFGGYSFSDLFTIPDLEFHLTDNVEAELYDGISSFPAFLKNDAVEGISDGARLYDATGLYYPKHNLLFIHLFNTHSDTPEKPRKEPESLLEKVLSPAPSFV